MNHLNLYNTKKRKMKKLLMETFGAIAIVVLGLIVSAMFAFAACSNSQQCMDRTIENGKSYQEVR
tara:strand:- start:1209 stop:1403 length:195 start_codon:yes stop_codon:yes gene_type:complete